jgi:predicted ATPase
MPRAARPEGRPGPAAPCPRRAVPASLHDALMARLDRLTPVRELAQVAAVIGREFGHELLAAVAGTGEGELRRALSELVTAELVFARGEPGPGAIYSFKHALVRDAAYESLLRSRRHQLHLRVAAALEERWPETREVQPELLAHHYAEGGLAAKAVSYCLAAGRRSVATSAMAEAVAQLRRGLDLVSVLPGDERRRHELDLRITLGQALIASQGYGAPAVGDAYARALQLCEELGQPPQLVPALYGQWVHRLLRNELGPAAQLAERMLRLGEARGEARVRLMGHRLSGITRFQRGALAAARSHLEGGSPTST